MLGNYPARVAIRRRNASGNCRKSGELRSIGASHGRNHRRFQLANVTSAMLWVPLMFAPGYFAARSLGSVEQSTKAHIFGIGRLVAALERFSSVLNRDGIPMWREI